MLLTIIAFFAIVNCSNSTRPLPLDAKDFIIIQNKQTDSPLTLPRNSTSSTRITSTYTYKPTKWQVERFTRKQYEIINLLWRKTKIFVNVEYSTTSQHKQDNFTKKIFDLIPEGNPITFSSRSPISQTSTPSYIEFYYSEEIDDKSEQKECLNAQCQPKNYQKIKTYNPPNSSFVIFHIKAPPQKIKTTGKSTYSKSRTFKKYTKKPTVQTFKTVPEVKLHVFSSVLGTKKDDKTKSTNCTTYEPKSTQIISEYPVKKHQTESTTIYDKIKFFEIYDQNTPVPFSKKENMLKFEYNENADKELEINNVHKISLEQVDQSAHEHNEAKHSKKHIVENDKNMNESCLNIIEGDTKPKTHTLNVSTERQNNTSSAVTSKSPIKLESPEYNNAYSYVNKTVSWSEYPFVAVYVYEPLQVHCDAASISAHWLVASGSCLSHLNQIPELGEGRSAFVSYCGDHWWQPERVSYVKYSVVHPSYHHRDKNTKHLYNIGVIQVVTSMMSACSDWAPVSLMSHQFTAIQGDSEAIALGWGLDRYDTRYTSTELPKSSLTIYKGLVFSDSCPGNIGYMKIKRFDEEGGVNNIYCLSLPPYSGEEHDPVHGSLLLVDGKLMALYLQEERRPWGEQSAQYTGIWRLIPWVVEVAREPEDIESFMDI